MFTPPPSPQPPRVQSSSGVASSSTSEFRTSEKGAHQQEEYLRSVELKRRTSRRFRIAAVLAPLLLISLTLCASYFSHSESLDLWSERASRRQWYALLQDPSGWAIHHKREPQSQGQSSSSSSSSTQSSSSASTTLPSQTNQPLPTVPSSPPVLPTPFPQAFDGNIQQNFSSASCLSFFTNMTQTSPFRSCRPFSMLLQTSSTFVNAQTNLTLLNNLVWGMCNTNTTFSQCESNMDWFATNLRISCAVDLQAKSTVVQTTLVALEAFSLMHNVACLEDPTSNSYCYVNAARSPNPIDQFYYQMPLGTPIPTMAVATCSACSKSIMGLYVEALKDPNQRPQLTGLASTYDSSAQLSAQYCGSSFAPTNLVGAGRSSFASLPSLTAWAMWLGCVWTALMAFS